MKKVLEINAVPYGSTCNIMLGIKKYAENMLKSRLTVDTASGYSTHPVKYLPYNHYSIGSYLEKAFHIVCSVLTGFDCCFSFFPTLRLIRHIRKDKYHIIHFHNLHGRYVNLPLLFWYVKKNNIPIIWTLHDCWSFTGQCPHFTMVKCEKWKTGCHDCPQINVYPSSLIDNTKFMWKLKKKWFTGVKNLTIVTPSQWLADLVKQSFLKNYPVMVIHNGIDLNIFKPAFSDFRKKYGITENKFILLGVAFGWGRRKGLDVFLDLYKRLPQDKFQIVLVGTDAKVDKQLPKGIISIHRTQNQQQLAEIYTAADLFVNPTREENYPTVNMESIACGTPVLTFKTGGSPEILTPETGFVVPCDDVNALEQEILRIEQERPFTEQACLEHARSFGMYERFQEYVKMYEDPTHV